MNQNVWGLLNWLDGVFRPVEAPTFGYKVVTEESGGRTFEVRGLKVWIYKNRDDWIAQGLDIGFSASGKTLEEARDRFMRGLFATIDQNLRRFGSLEQLIRPADPECWLEWRKAVRHMNRQDDGRCERPDGGLFNGSVLDPHFYCPTA